MKYYIVVEDALDHGNIVDEYDDIRVANEAFQDMIKEGPEGYDIGVELVQEDYDEVWETIEYHEWYTQEEWEAAHPNGIE